MRTEKLIHDEKVYGAGVDAETRCAHYNSEIDIIAIKFNCCQKWFPCYECHAEQSDHAALVWKRTEFDTPAILCGACGHQLTVNEYLNCNSVCPRCRSQFNPGCANHYYLYFEKD
jgi:uncharacterized CHY-type Zn-finger protein